MKCYSEGKERIANTNKGWLEPDRTIDFGVRDSKKWPVGLLIMEFKEEILEVPADSKIDADGYTRIIDEMGYLDLAKTFDGTPGTIYTVEATTSRDRYRSRFVPLVASGNTLDEAYAALQPKIEHARKLAIKKWGDKWWNE